MPTMSFNQAFQSFVIVVALGGMMPALHAADQPSTSSASGAASKSSLAAPMPASHSASSTQTAAGPASAAKTINGSLSAVNLTASAPSVKVTGADGTVWTLAVDPSAVSVWRAGQRVAANQLQVGQRVTVHATDANGQPTAQTIQIRASTQSGAAPTQSPVSAQ